MAHINKKIWPLKEDQDNLPYSEVAGDLNFVSYCEHNPIEVDHT